MKKYSHTWWGAGLVCFLAAGLLALVPSRLTLLRERYGPPSPTPITWVVTPVTSPAPGAHSSGAAKPKSPAPSPQAAAVDHSVSRREAEPEPGLFTLDFGTFATAREAEQVENRLRQLGASTTRYHKRSGSALYALNLGDFATPAKARETLEQLRLRHPTLPLAPMEQNDPERITLAVATLYPLREAVALAEQLKTEGFTVRIAAIGKAAQLFTVRLATTHDRKTAQEKSREFGSHGLPNAVIPAARPSLP